MISSLSIRLVLTKSTYHFPSNSGRPWSFAIFLCSNRIFQPLSVDIVLIAKRASKEKIAPLIHGRRAKGVVKCPKGSEPTGTTMDTRLSEEEEKHVLQRVTLGFETILTYGYRCGGFLLTFERPHHL